MIPPTTVWQIILSLPFSHTVAPAATTSKAAGDALIAKITVTKWSIC